MYSGQRAYKTRYAFILVVLLNNMCLTEGRERVREGDGQTDRQTDRVKVGALIISREHGWQM